MRIIIHSNGPMVPSGYGTQTKLLMLALRDMGHEVAASCFSGLGGSSIMWDGFQLFPGGTEAFSPDVVVEHALNFGADVLITLMDTWKLAPAADRLARAPFHVVLWTPTDCSPIGHMDGQVIAGITGAVPVAMSKFGRKQMEDAGFEASYIPHMIDTTVFKPLEDRDEFRKQIGVAGKFTIGICAANQDAVRKAWPEQFEAFRDLHAKHPDTLLMVHSLVENTNGHKLASLASDMGILDCTLFTDQYAQKAGLLSPAMMSDWFGSLDVLSSCSFGEGFGIPIIEAQAAGTPVIVTDFGAMKENAGPAAQLVKGQPFWNWVHRARWCRPDIDAIVRAYEKAYRERGKPAAAQRRERSREWALKFDIQQVVSQYWKPLLDGLEATPKPHEDVPGFEEDNSDD